MWFQWDERGAGRRWWKKWPSKESYDVNQGQKGQDVGIWDGDIRKFTNGTFNGYFPDIRDIANRAIRPESQLSLNLNGGNITDRSDITLAMSVASTSRSNVTLQKYQKFMTESFEPDLDTPKTPRTIDNYKNPPKPIDRKLLSLKSEKDYDIPKKPSRCTRVERFLVGTSLYLAIAVLIMLIIITVMVFSLKDINKSIANINVVSFYFIFIFKMIFRLSCKTGMFCVLVKINDDMRKQMSVLNRIIALHRSEAKFVRFKKSLN